MRIRRILAVILTLALLPLTALAETTAPANTEPAQTVRVLLRRLGLNDRADLTILGAYAAQTGDGTFLSFEDGTQATVLVRDGALVLFCGGMAVKAGASLTLTRSASAQTSGIRFSESGNLYPGDLSLTVKDGVLRPVCTLSVEDYLLGVVPNEMSEYFPMEALKAQAVCARTYALSHVNTSRDYDLVDTTDDQVFKGVNATQVNAAKAVAETAGVVGIYKGQYATCYYSASNGGQTELVENVWGAKGDYGYFAMADDPYDLENPESVVKYATIKKSGGVLSAFAAVVAENMADTLTKAGYEATSDAFRVDSVSALTLNTPKYGEPSRMYSKMTLTFTWSARKNLGYPAEAALTADAQASASPAPAAETAKQDGDTEINLFMETSDTPAPSATPAPAATVAATLSAESASPEASPIPTPTPTPAPTPIYGEWESGGEATLTFDVFPAAVRALGLSISGGNNEMLTVKETDTAFLLEARRFGHGVGMSQRGAQWMAGQYNKTFYEILAFYYPGMELGVVAGGALTLPTVEPALAETPGPPATPTPRPTLMPVTGELPEGAYLASVEGIEDDSSLNLRAEPNGIGEILMRLYKHQQLVVLETCEDEAWVKVKTDSVEGYVMVSFLEKVEE